MVDGESLLNDGTGLVLFAIAVSAVYAPVSPIRGGRVVRRDRRAQRRDRCWRRASSRPRSSVRSDDHLIELTITVVLAYGGYLLADQLGLSGVIATVTAGIVLGNLGPARQRAQDGTDAIDTVWEFIAYLLTAVVFLLVGLAIPPAQLFDALGPIAWGIVGDPDRPGVRRVRPARWRLAAGRPARPRRAHPRAAGCTSCSGPVCAGRWPSRWRCRCRPTSRSAHSSRRSPSGSSCSRLLVQGTTIGWVVDRTVRRERAPRRTQAVSLAA